MKFLPLLFLTTALLAGSGECCSLRTYFVSVKHGYLPEICAELTKRITGSEPTESDRIPLQVAPNPRTKEIFLLGTIQDMDRAEQMIPEFDRPGKLRRELKAQIRATRRKNRLIR